jgi:hypothetical protein
LSAEFLPIELAVFKVIPENSFCNRRRIAEFLATVLVAGDVVDPTLVFTHDTR